MNARISIRCCQRVGKLLQGEALGVHELFPTFVGLAVVLPARGQLLAQRRQFRFRLVERNGSLGLQPGLLHDEGAIDEPVDGLLAREVAGRRGKGLEGREATLLVHVAFEDQVSIDHGDDLIDQHACGWFRDFVDGLPVREPSWYPATLQRRRCAC